MIGAFDAKNQMFLIWDQSARTHGHMIGSLATLSTAVWGVLISPISLIAQTLHAESKNLVGLKSLSLQKSICFKN